MSRDVNSVMLSEGLALTSTAVPQVRPIARLTERGVHMKNMWVSGHMLYNLMRFKLSMLYLQNTRLVSG